MLKQKVTCDKSIGLECMNKDQRPVPKCYDYEIRIQCCTYVHCEPSTTTPQSTTTTETTTITHPTTTTQPTSTTEITSTTEVTTTFTPTSPVSTQTSATSTTTVTSTTETSTASTSTPTTTQCVPEMKCLWTEWYNVGYPQDGQENGDNETFENLRDNRKQICEKPNDIECRAQKYPTQSLSMLKQKVTCDKSIGLECRNKDQRPVPKCYDYEIRVQCCTYVHCEPSTTTPQSTTTMESTTITNPTTTTQPTSTTEITSTTEVTTTVTPTSPVSTQTSATSITTVSSTTETSTASTSTPSTTQCIPEKKCLWTEWYNVGYPQDGQENGDNETFENLRDQRKQICEKPNNIECRAQKYPTLSLSMLKQNVTCDKSIGLECKNKDQSPVPKCYDYEIRIQCCTYVHCEPSTTTPQSTTTTEPTTTMESTTTYPTTTTEPTTTTQPTSTTEFSSTMQPTTTSQSTMPTLSTTTTLPTTTTEQTSTTEVTTSVTPSSTVTTQTSASSTTVFSTTESSTLTSCMPICKWTTWFDIDKPGIGSTEGDYETFNNIRAAGHTFCARPVDIECIAEKNLNQSIKQNDPTVQCDVTFGLVCENEKQTGDFKMCPNYKVRVHCCDCVPDTSPTTTMKYSTSPQTTTNLPTSTTAMSTTPNSTLTPATTHTIPCYCLLNNTVFHPTEQMHQENDTNGCTVYWVCSDSCGVDRIATNCTTVTTPPTTSPTTPPTTSPTTPQHLDCDPYKENETWNAGNCTLGTCRGNNIVIFEKVKCPEVKQLTCANGLDPIKITSDDGCCYHYECECMCYGWGDPHYTTFDGTYYTFLDNCTYTLVKQIIPRYGNFSILIDNYFCGASDGVSCPRSLYVYYGSDEVMLTWIDSDGRQANQIKFNNELTIPSFTKNGITVTTDGIDMTVTIADINAYIVFSGLQFYVKLPFSKFGYNTEGQCGTCTNNRIDDCRMPNGTVVADCSKMAPEWKVNTTGQLYCKQTTMPPKNCTATALCQVIQSKVFAACHAVVPYRDYYEGCVFDGCHVSNVSVQCSSLEAYASRCRSKGVCIDWRSQVKGQCPFICKEGMKYNACGPAQPSTCDLRAPASPTKFSKEGCFCPNGTMLFNSYTNLCVAKCSCVGPDGLPKMPGETWWSNCQFCTCEKNTLIVQCVPVSRRSPSTVTCDKEGFEPVLLPNATNNGCMDMQCRCNTSLCSKKTLTCPLGFKSTPFKLAGDCCFNFTCEPLPVCVYNGAMYEPGAIIPPLPGVCQNCTCAVKINTTSALHQVACVDAAPSKDCPLGYAYKDTQGKCCGTCVQVSCTVTTKDNITHEIMAGVTWTSPNDQCASYNCKENNGHFELITVMKSCPALNEDDCVQGSIQRTPDGCCQTCKAKEACDLRKNSTILNIGACRSTAPVELSYCDGTCNTNSMYSTEANTMTQKCSCCKEQKTIPKQVDLTCFNASSVVYTYPYVLTCGCSSTACGEEGGD